MDVCLQTFLRHKLNVGPLLALQLRIDLDAHKKDLKGAHFKVHWPDKVFILQNGLKFVIVLPRQIVVDSLVVVRRNVLRCVALTILTLYEHVPLLAQVLMELIYEDVFSVNA